MAGSRFYSTLCLVAPRRVVVIVLDTFRATGRPHLIDHTRRLLPGILVCIAITLAANLLEAIEVALVGQAYLEALVLAYQAVQVEVAFPHADDGGLDPAQLFRSIGNGVRADDRSVKLFAGIRLVAAAQRRPRGRHAALCGPLSR